MRSESQPYTVRTETLPFQIIKQTVAESAFQSSAKFAGSEQNQAARSSVARQYRSKHLHVSEASSELEREKSEWKLKGL